MLLKECYDSFGGSYESVRQRIPKDELIKKFVTDFLHEPTYGKLSNALESENYEKAFHEAHTLKGICLNLSFQRLANSTAVLTELLRPGSGKQIDKVKCREAFERVAEDYKVLVDAVRNLEEA